jgi:urease accessory protein
MALITTPGATKFYRSAGRPAEQRQRLRVESGGGLEWFPQENIFFPATESRLATRIELAGAARFIGWELGVLGRPVNGERFDAGSVELRLELWRDGKPLLIERLPVKGGDGLLESRAGLRGFPLAATLLATPATPAHLEAARAALPELEEELCALTLVDGLLIGRYLGRQAERARRCFIPVWRALRPMLLGRAAEPPRIWSC